LGCIAHLRDSFISSNISGFVYKDEEEDGTSVRYGRKSSCGKASGIEEVNWNDDVGEKILASGAG
jgi:hypothetical protein